MTLREEFNATMTGAHYDWTVYHHEKCDEVGPLRVEYIDEKTVAIFIEKKLLGMKQVADGRFVFKFFNEVRNKIADEALLLWKERFERYIFRRRYTMKELLIHAGPNKRAELIFALSALRAGLYGPVKVWTLPPSMTTQKDAVNLPRMDKPGFPERVYQIEVRRVK